MTCRVASSTLRKWISAGLADVCYLTNSSMMNLHPVPKHPIVVGRSYIGRTMLGELSPLDLSPL